MSGIPCSCGVRVPARPSTGATVKVSQVPGRSNSPLWTATARSGRWLTSSNARDTVGYHLLVDLVRVGREAPSRLSSHSPERFGWDLAGIASSAGLEVRSDSSLGATGVLADLGDQAAPVVYVETLNCC